MLPLLQWKSLKMENSPNMENRQEYIEMAKDVVEFPEKYKQFWFGGSQHFMLNEVGDWALNLILKKQMDEFLVLVKIWNKVPMRSIGLKNGNKLMELAVVMLERGEDEVVLGLMEKLFHGPQPSLQSFQPSILVILDVLKVASGRVALLGLQVLRLVQLNGSNAKKKFEMMVKHVLPCLVKLWDVQNGELCSLIGTVLSEALFEEDHFNGILLGLVYPAKWTSGISGVDALNIDKASKGSYQNLLFAQLQLWCNDESDPRSVAGMLSSMVVGFQLKIQTRKGTSTSKKRKRSHNENANANAVFSFWIEIVSHVLRMLNVKHCVPILVEMFQLLNTHHVYRIINDDEEQTHLRCLQNMATYLLALFQKQSGDTFSQQLEIFVALNEANPKIILDSLDALLQYCILHGARDGYSNCDAIFVELCKSFSSIRNLELFLSSVLKLQTKHSSDLTIWLNLPQVVAVLAQSFQILPPGQLEGIFDLLIQDFNVQSLESGATIILTNILLQNITVNDSTGPVVNRVLEACFQSVLFPTFALSVDVASAHKVCDAVGGHFYSFVQLLIRAYPWCKEIEILSVLSAVEPVVEFLQIDTKIDANLNNELKRAMMCFGYLRLTTLEDSTKDLKPVATLAVHYFLKISDLEDLVFNVFLIDKLVAVIDIAQIAQHIVNQPHIAKVVLNDAAFYELPNLGNALAKVMASAFISQECQRSAYICKKLKQLAKLLDSNPMHAEDVVTNEYLNLICTSTGSSDEISSISWMGKILVEMPLECVSSNVLQVHIACCVLFLNASILQVEHAPLSQIAGKVKLFDQGLLRLLNLLYRFNGEFQAFTLQWLLQLWQRITSLQQLAKLDTSTTTFECILQFVFKKFLHEYESAPVTIWDENQAWSLAGKCNLLNALSAKKLKKIEYLQSIASSLAANIYSAWSSSHDVKATRTLLVYSFANPMFKADTLYAIVRETVFQMCSSGNSIDKNGDCVISLFAYYCANVDQFTKQAQSVEYPTLIIGHTKFATAIVHANQIDYSMDSNWKRLRSAFGALLLHPGVEHFKFVLDTILQNLRDSTRESYRIIGIEMVCCILQSSALKRDDNRTLFSALRISILQAISCTSIAPCNNRISSIVPLPLTVMSLMVSKKEIGALSDIELTIVLSSLRCIQDMSFQMECDLSPVGLYRCWMFGYVILSRILRTYSQSISNVMPLYIAGCQSLFRAVCAFSKSSNLQGNQTNECLRYLCRLYSYMTSQGSVFRKYVVTLLLEYISACQLYLDARQQLILQPGVYSLIDICSTHELGHLYAVIDPVGRSVFDALHRSYKENHKYVGKI